MAEAAAANVPEESSPEIGSNIVPMPGVDAQPGGLRRTEGGLSLNFTFDIPKLPNIRAVPSWTHQQLINGGLIAAVALLAVAVAFGHFFGQTSTAAPKPLEASSAVRPNVATSFNPSIDTPRLAPTAYVDRLSSVIGDVALGEHVFVAPFASIRGDEGQPIVIGDNSNVQDMVVVHALETFDKGKLIEKNLVTVEGKQYAVYIGSSVSLAHQSQVHGPAAVGDHTFIGMQAFVFKSTIGRNVVIEPGAKVIGVVVGENRYVPAGAVITTQSQADALPRITSDYPYATLNNGVLEVNEAFADAYAAAAGGKPEAAAAGHD